MIAAVSEVLAAEVSGSEDEFSRSEVLFSNR
jgi:hypothetical protein